MIFIILTALGKKIYKFAKDKECELISKWKKSIINHLYWCAVSTREGNGELIQENWLSIDNHIHNKHKKHAKWFPACQHKRIQTRGRRKKWFKRREFDN